MQIAILGRQPALGLAELEQVFGAQTIEPFADQFAFVDADISLERLGGTTKVAKHLTTLPTANPQKVFDYCRRELPKHLQYVPEGKLKLGISLYGFDMPIDRINANMLSLKKVVKNAGRSVRVIPNTHAELSSAQTYHNSLTSPLGMELVGIKVGNETVLGQVTQVQDFEAFAARDQARPKTDAFVGMLPPKLALMMVNLSGTHEGRVLDPFCGTGVVLQEAALLGHDVYGTDLAEKMVRYSEINMKWLKEKYALSTDATLEEADAMTASWKKPIDAVVAETYLGQPFSAPPSSMKLKEVRGNCNHIISNFLKNIAGQLSPGTPLCLAVPAWRDGRGMFTHLPLVENLDSLGYSEHALTHVRSRELLYFREDQIVARQLLVLTKI
ncbi:MAG TPA: DNA methyltransferase [Candidatus Saccharibacteria bacterium]|nr:DNA methyltransferase [Candidatus Saccharibacteria bacterium]